MTAMTSCGTTIVYDAALWAQRKSVWCSTHWEGREREGLGDCW